MTELAKLPSDSAHCCVTSPPFYGLRDYGIDAQLGLESTLDEYLTKLVAVLAEVRRVLHPLGVCFVDMGDSFASAWPAPSNRRNIDQPMKGGKRSEMRKDRLCGLKEKDRLLVPFRLALALQANGWFVRDVIAWHKLAPMPESVTDRFTQSWEPILMLTKNSRYFFDQEAVRESNSDDMLRRAQAGYARGGNGKLDVSRGDKDTLRGEQAKAITATGRNMRNVWSLCPEPLREEHFAAFPSEIPRRCILAGTSARGVCPKCLAPWKRIVEKDHPGDRSRVVPTYECDGVLNRTMHPGSHPAGCSLTVGWSAFCSCAVGDPIPATVLDPFLGSGTTAMVALELGRNAVGIELSEDYCAIARRRLAGVTPGLALA